MLWNLDEALNYYGSQGAPSDQMMLISLLKEIQRENGGITKENISAAAKAYGVKESFILAMIRSVPSLRVMDTHRLEICGGRPCEKRAKLAAFIRKTYGEKPEGFEVKCTGCMHACGKGPNIKWDGTMYHGADEALIQKLVEESRKK